MNFNKKGDVPWYVIALVLALIVLAVISWGFISEYLRGKGIIKGYGEKLNDTVGLSSFWDELSDDQKAKYIAENPEQSAKKMFEQAEAYLSEGQRGSDKDLLLKAKRLAEDILKLNNISENARERAREIIKSVDESLSKLTAQQYYASAIDKLSAGKRDDALAELNKCINEYGNTAEGAKCAAKAFVERQDINAQNFEGETKRYETQELEKAAGDNNKRAQALYTAGLIYEFGAIKFNQDFNLINALLKYKAAHNLAPRNFEFSTSAQLRRGLIQETYYARLKKSENEGKREAFEIYKELLKDYGDLHFSSVQETKVRIKELIDKGYADALSLSVSLSGSVRDNDSPLSLTGDPEYARFENLRPDGIMESKLANVKREDLGTDFGMDAQFTIYSNQVIKEKGFDEVESIASDRPLWMYMEMKEPVSGVVLCKLESEEEKRIRFIDIAFHNVVKKCGEYVSLKGAGVFVEGSGLGKVTIKMRVIFDYFGGRPSLQQNSPS